MNLHIPGTDRTPNIALTAEPLSLRIEGDSYPEDVAAFYGPVIQAVGSLATECQGALQFSLALVYVNSSSIKALYRIFEGVEAYRQAGHAVKVTWQTPDDDDIMEELGEDFKDRFPALNMVIEAL